MKKSKLPWERGIVNFLLAISFQSSSDLHSKAPEPKKLFYIYIFLCYLFILYLILYSFLTIQLPTSVYKKYSLCRRFT